MYQSIDAVVILKSRNDEQGYKSELAQDSAQVGDYLPDLDTIIQSSRYFRDAGFTVLPKQNCIRISGSSSQFESMFGVYIQPGAKVGCVGNIRVPDLLDGVLVRLLFQEQWAQAS